MPNRVPPSTGYDLSDRQLSRSSLNNPLRDFLANYARRDRVTHFDDFLGDTVDLNNYAVVKQGTGVAFAISAATNGTIIASTETGVVTSPVSLVTPAIWSGNHNASFEARLKINTIASTYIMEAGFIDAVPGSAGPGIADIDTATGATMTSGALFHINTAQTHAGIAFGTNGDFTGQTFATTLLTSGFTAPVANTYLTVKVQLLTAPGETGKSKAYLWVNGKLRATHAPAAGAVDGQQLLAGWLYLQAVASGALVYTCDYIRISQDRASLGSALE
jgi:hypothetical protein